MGVILLCPTTRIHSLLENGWQRYFRGHKIGKGTFAMFVGIGHQRIAWSGPYMDRGGEAN